MIEPPKTVAAERLHERVTARAAEPEEPIRPELVERAREVAEAHKRIMTLFAKKNGLPPPPDDPPPESGDRKEKVPAETELVLDDEEALEVRRAEALLAATEAALGIDGALDDADLEVATLDLDQLVNETKEMNYENENAPRIDCNPHALGGADGVGVSAECGEALNLDLTGAVNLDLDLDAGFGPSR